MRSSISSSDRRVWRPITLVALAAIVFCMAIAPIEIAVRRVEAQFGRNAKFGYPGTDAAKLDWFLDITKQGVRPSTLIVGNSQAEYGVHPGDLAASLGRDESDIYNLAFSGTSALTGLAIIGRLGWSPKLVVVALSAADLSRPMTERGDKLLQQRGAQLGTGVAATSLREQVGSLVAHSVRQIIRASDPRYRRSLSDFQRLLLAGTGALVSITDVGRFLTSGRLGREDLAGGRYHIAYFRRGFLGLEMLKPWTADDFERVAVRPSEEYYRAHIFPSYRTEAPRLWHDLATQLARLRQSGTRVVLVRLPAYQPFLEIEDQETGFGAALETFAMAERVEYIKLDRLPDGFLRAPSTFRDAAHLHADSATIYTRWLGEHLKR